MWEINFYDYATKEPLAQRHCISSSVIPTKHDIIEIELGNDEYDLYVVEQRRLNYKQMLVGVFVKKLEEN